MPGLARALVANRERLTGELFGVVADWERTTKMVAEGCVEQAAAGRLPEAPVRDGDPLYEQLYIGEKLKQLHYEPLQGGTPRVPGTRGD